MLLFASNGLYSRRNLLGGIEEYSLVFRTSSIGLLLVIIAGFLEPGFILARGWLLLAWLFVFLWVGIGRFFLRRVVYWLRRRGYFLTPALIIGANEEACSIAKQLVSWQTSGLNVLGFVDDNFSPGTRIYRHLYAVGNLSQLDYLLDRYKVQELILATSALSRNHVVSLFKKYGLVNGIEVRLSSGLYELITTSVDVKETAYVPLVRVNKVRLKGLDWVQKLILDYSLTLPIMILFSPLFLLLTLAVKLDSPGPAIYRRRVMGLNGRTFDAFKFRTMHVNGDEILAKFPELQEELSQEHKLKNDPRVTRIGRILRKYSLDELPQLMNVIKRDMSLVGPRIIAPDEMSKYDQWSMNLLTVPPGITGQWQVSGRSDISYEERVRLDMHYIRNWTIWLDLQLLFRTIPAVLKSHGAY
jgi:exopolysaccharide biosynthesis polyprenyl glycosylphosphotransferase